MHSISIEQIISLKFVYIQYLKNNQNYYNRLRFIRLIIRVMSTVNRLKHRKKAAEHSGPHSNDKQQPESQMSSPLKSRNQYEVVQNKHTQQQQKQYEAYYQISQCNPQGITTTNSVFPHSAALQSNFAVPLGFCLSPILSLQNQGIQLMQKSGDKIPRCQACRAYMNCYNRIQKKKFTCFLCNRESSLDPNYNSGQHKNLQLQSSLFQCLSPINYYPKQPAEQTIIFLIDINSDSASSRMLYYATAVIKEVFSRADLDDLCIYFFTYDELVQEYDFSGEDIKCTINDQSIEGVGVNSQPSYLKNIRQKLFDLLDSLQQISANNPRKGSNFSKCFDYVFSSLKHTGGKIIILQSNQAIAGQAMLKQQVIKNPMNPNQIPAKKGPSIFETCNKSFMQKYTYKLLENDCSIGFFIFQKNYKNLKAITDTLKLCSSELKVYSKDNASDLEKFYYEFSYILGTTNFKNLRTQFIINTGWQFTAIYGNFYRIKQFITFQITNCEPSRKVTVMVAPTPHNQFNQYVPPFCSFQMITNYQYKRQAYLCVATIVQPVTGYVEKLYPGIDYITTITCLAKGYFSSLRMDDLNVSRKRITQVASNMYLCALRCFKKPQQIPQILLTIIQSMLGMLKSIHSQPDQINNTPIMDRIISQRNMFQFSGCQITNYFNPFLFNLSNLDNHMCVDEGEFVYPPTVDIKFHNVKDGMYLMDVGIALYLFIAKQCDPTLSSQILGKQKFSKNDQLTEQLLNNQTSFQARQVQSLIKFLREQYMHQHRQKSYGWVPLYIVRCGENSFNQHNFYLFFYGEKYEQFRSYRMNLQEFIAIISKPNSF